MMSIFSELWQFMRVRKKWWLGPILVTMVLLSALIVLTEGSAVARQKIVARIEGRRIVIEAEKTNRLTLRLSDDLLDLDQPLEIVVNGKTRFEGVVKRSLDAMIRSLEERPDPRSVCTALLELKW